MHSHSNTVARPAGPAAEALCALVLRVALVDAAVTAERSLELAHKLFAQAQLRRWQSHTAAVVRELVRVQCSTTEEYPSEHHCPRTTALPEWGYPAPPRYRTSAFTFALTFIGSGCDHHRWASMLVEG